MNNYFIIIFIIILAGIIGAVIGIFLFFFVKTYSFMNEFENKIYQPMKTLAEKDGITEACLEASLVNQGARFLCRLDKLSPRPRFNELLDEMLDDMIKDFSENYKKNYQLDQHYDILNSKVVFSLKLVIIPE